jgi:hypothetical protein
MLAVELAVDLFLMTFRLQITLQDIASTNGDFSTEI